MAGPSGLGAPGRSSWPGFGTACSASGQGRPGGPLLPALPPPRPPPPSARRAPRPHRPGGRRALRARRARSRKFHFLVRSTWRGLSSQAVPCLTRSHLVARFCPFYVDFWGFCFLYIVGNISDTAASSTLAAHWGYYGAPTMVASLRANALQGYGTAVRHAFVSPFPAQRQPRPPTALRPSPRRWGGDGDGRNRAMQMAGADRHRQGARRAVCRVPARLKTPRLGDRLAPPAMG